MQLPTSLAKACSSLIKMTVSLMVGCCTLPPLALIPTPSHERFTKIKTHKAPGVAVKHAEMIMTMAMAMMILIKVPLVMMNLD